MGCGPKRLRYATRTPRRGTQTTWPLKSLRWSLGLFQSATSSLKPMLFGSATRYAFLYYVIMYTKIYILGCFVCIHIYSNVWFWIFLPLCSDTRFGSYVYGLTKQVWRVLSPVFNHQELYMGKKRKNELYMRRRTHRKESRGFDSFYNTVPYKEHVHPTPTNFKQ